MVSMGTSILANPVVVSLVVGALSVYLAHPGHPHDIPARNPAPPTPQSLDGTWSVNEDLTRLGKFMAKGLIQRAETVFVKDRVNCDEAYATDVRVSATQHS